MAKTKVLHVVNSLEPGGMENGVVNMIAALDSEFEFQVACIERRGRFVERLANPGIVYELGKKNGFSPPAAMRLRSSIQHWKPDLIHSHNLGPLIYAALATLGGITAPIVQGEHAQLNSEDCCPRRLLQRRLLYRCCRKVHTVSLAQKEELVARGFKNVCSVVNGVDVSRFCPGLKPQAQASLGLPENSLVVGIVGRFGLYKRHELLIESFGKLSATQPNLHLLIVGAGGPEEARVRRLGEQSPARERIHFSGFQSDPVGFYRAMDFLVVPSMNEGLSNAVLEAMACAVPVLAHQACGNQEVIETRKQGIVMDLGSPEAICEGMLAMLKSDLAAWGRHARDKCLEKFSLQMMARGYSELYRSALSAGANS